MLPSGKPWVSVEPELAAGKYGFSVLLEVEMGFEGSGLRLVEAGSESVWPEQRWL